ncbi:MAG: hypothetical protein HYT46_00125 [Candidatus Vogelbacteria bacterium]|nr:hypothetical protein [Candidatus Vogelbacteria bacterium]
MKKGTKKIISPTKLKVLLLFGSGVMLGLTRSPKQYFKLVRTTTKLWHFIDETYLRRLVKEFYEDRLVDYRERDDGKIEVVITERGRNTLLRYDIDRLEIRPSARWDGKWRIVIFDIPERLRTGRDALRQKLRELGFQKLQESVFIIPHPCANEINFLIEFFDLRYFVRLLETDKITNEAELLLKFKLRK